MLDYKDVIIKRYVLGMSGRAIARELNVSKTGVNDFLKAFEACETLVFPLPEGITNYGIAELVYGTVTGIWLMVLGAFGFPGCFGCVFCFAMVSLYTPLQRISTLF